MGSRILIAASLFQFILVMASLSFGHEIKTRYVTITYETKAHLHEFNDKLYLGRLKCLLKKRRALTIEDEVKNKIDLIIEKAETVLEIFPNTLKFKINLVPSPKEVQKAYYNIYSKKVDYIAFYSPGKNTVFYSVKHDKELRVGLLMKSDMLSCNIISKSPHLSRSMSFWPSLQKPISAIKPSPAALKGF